MNSFPKLLSLEVQRWTLALVLTMLIALLPIQLGFTEDTGIHHRDVALKLSVRKSPALPCEPLFLSVILDTGDHTSLTFPIGPGDALLGTYIDVYIKNPSASVFNRFAPNSVAGGAWIHQDVGPGSSLKFEGELLSTRAKFLLDDVGSYQVYVEVELKVTDSNSGDNAKYSLQSNVIDLEVAEPDENEALALELWRSGFGVGASDLVIGDFSDCGKSVELVKSMYSENFWRDQRTQPLVKRAMGDAAEFTKLREIYPDTVYGRYSRFFNVIQIRERLDDQVVINELEAIRKADSSFPLMNLLLDNMARRYSYQRDYPATIRIYRELLEREPERGVKERITRALEAYEKQVNETLSNGD